MFQEHIGDVAELSQTRRIVLRIGRIIDEVRAEQRLLHAEKSYPTRNFAEVGSLNFQLDAGRWGLSTDLAIGHRTSTSSVANLGKREVVLMAC